MRPIKKGSVQLLILSFTNFRDISPTTSGKYSDNHQNYCDAVIRSDINRTDNMQKNPERVRRLMRSFARNQGGQVPNTVLAQDTAANDEMPINEETAASYVNAQRYGNTKNASLARFLHTDVRKKGAPTDFGDTLVCQSLKTPYSGSSCFFIILTESTIIGIYNRKYTRYTTLRPTPSVPDPT